MARMDMGAGLAFAADGVTAAAGAFNAVALAARWRVEPSAGRRHAAVALATLNAGAALQAAFAQALYTAHRFAFDTAPFYAPGPWLASRALVLAGVLLIAALILRRLR